MKTRIESSETLTLDANPSDAPCCVKLEATDGKSILFQTDWDWPAVAGLFGWSTEHTKRQSTLEFDSENDITCPGSDATDGTIDCPHCGKKAGAFITEAREWLDNHDGETCENPGYTLE